MRYMIHVIEFNIVFKIILKKLLLIIISALQNLDINSISFLPFFFLLPTSNRQSRTSSSLYVQGCGELDWLINPQVEKGRSLALFLNLRGVLYNLFMLLGINPLTRSVHTRTSLASCFPILTSYWLFLYNCF